MNILIDQHGRHISKLRVNLLDACNMRCLYCMPEDQKFKKINDLLTPEQMAKITNNLISFGINEVRLTGGEPLLHPQIEQIVKQFAKLNLKKLSLTTNGILLDKHIDLLWDQGIRHINISLDSLRENVFNYITKSQDFHRVYLNIMKAINKGFIIKTNTVLLKNINYEEIEDFIDFSANHNIEVRFLELMKIGHAWQYFDRHHISAQEAINKLEIKYKLLKVQMAKDATSFNYKIALNNQMAHIGFIASESKPFCEGCSRLRLSNQGEIRPCIMINEGPKVVNLSQDKYELVLQELINKKPFTRLIGTQTSMNEIGG